MAKSHGRGEIAAGPVKGWRLGAVTDLRSGKLALKMGGKNRPAGKRNAMKRILLAEDDNDMRQFLTRALKTAGYEVVSFDKRTVGL